MLPPMANTKTRREISIRGLTHSRLKTHCEAKKLDFAKLLDDIVNQKLDALGVPPETTLRP